MTPAASPLEIARWLVVERGLSVIPLDHPDAPIATNPDQVGKVPAVKWALFQTARPTADNLAAWFGNGTPRNLAIVTGPVSGIVVVDSDSPDAEAWAAANLPATPMVTRTAKGRHRYYRHPGGAVKNKVRIRDGVDVRADGGYCVAPGSLHVSGVRYEREGPWPPVAELPVFDRAWLAPVVAAETPAGLFDRDAVLQRARAYLAKIPPAIEGQGGDDATYRVACLLARDFALEDADALTLFHEWNAACLPPWSARELEAKLAHARQYGDGAIGSKLAEGRPAASAEAVYAHTDTGNAEYFAARYADAVRFDHQRAAFRIFTGHRWREDLDGQARRLLKAAVRARLRDAQVLEDRDARKAALRWALASESRGRLDAALALASVEPAIADAGQAWDRDPLLLGCENGLVDLRTGALRPGLPADRVTMSTGLAYDPAAACPRWRRFLAEIFGGDEALVAFVQRAAGYSATGITSEQVVFLCYGAGSNGKSTLLEVLSKTLGDYAHVAAAATFLHAYSQANAPTPDLAALAGRRFVTASEADESARLNESRLKVLTGGDAISARVPYAPRPFTFEPVLKIWFAFNHKPIVADDSFGFWRRVRLIPFLQTFPVDASLKPALLAERPGILAWLVEGVLAWQAEGLQTPACVSEATASYRADSDPLAEFLEAACELEPGAEVGAGELYAHYRAWADRQGYTDRDRLSQQGFGRRMAERFAKVHTRGGRVYRGVARRP